MIRKPQSTQPSPLHAVEEATQLLRQCGVHAWAWWLAGSCPLVLGLLYFVNDMSRAACAEARLPRAALLLSLLFWWMALAQSVFGDILLRQLRDDPMPSTLSFRGKLRFLTSQLLLQAVEPVLLTLAFVAMLPFGWVYAACHNYSLLALDTFRTGGRTRDLLRTACQQSLFRPQQNHGLLLLMPALALLVCANLHMAVGYTAYLSRVFTGEENALSRNPTLLLSTGIVAATLGVTYLIVGPLIRALYVLRCFQSFSQRNGADIAIAFKRARAAAAAVFALFWLSPSPAAYAEATPTAPAAEASLGIPPGHLNASIQMTLQKAAYQWRLPHQDTREATAPNWLETLLNDITILRRSMTAALTGLLEKLLTAELKEWLKKLWRGTGLETSAGDSLATRAATLQRLLKWLLAVLGVALASLLFWHWRKRPKASPKPVSADSTPIVDLADEQVLATQLPEAGWLNLAHEREQGGDF